MDDFMKTEAKDIISTAIEKASGATGINIEVLSLFTYNLCSIVRLQVREGQHGPSVRSLLALRDGRGFLLRGDAPS